MKVPQLEPGAVVEVSTRFGPAYVVFLRSVPDEGDLVLALPAVSGATTHAFQEALADGFTVFVSLADILKSGAGRRVGRVQVAHTDVPPMRYREQLGNKRRWRLWSGQDYGKAFKRLSSEQALLPVKQWVNPDMLGMMLVVGYRPEFDIEGPDAVLRLAEARGIDLHLEEESTAGLPRHFLYFNSVQAAEAAQAQLSEALRTEVRTTAPHEHVLLVWATEKQVDWPAFAQATGGEYDGFERTNESD